MIRFLASGALVGLLFCKGLLADPLPFPPADCEREWADFKEVTLPHSDESYSSYQERMAERNLIRKNCHKKWTVFLYMAANNDLYPYSLADLTEMEMAGSTLRTDIIVQLEAPSGTRRLHVFQNSAPAGQPLKKEDLSQLSEQSIQSPTVSWLETPSSQPKDRQLLDFLHWGIEEYPSEYYLVLIWGHGQGWTAFSGPKKIRPRGGLAFSTATEYMDIPSLQKVLKQASDWTGGPLAGFCTDACYMQGVENAVQLAGAADYIYGSSDVESKAGFPYHALFKELNIGKFKRARRFLKKKAPHRDYDERFLLLWTLPELYKRSFDPGGSQHDLDPAAAENLTGCTIDTRHLRLTLLPLMHQLGKTLVEYIQEDDFRWLELKSLVQKGPFLEVGAQDLGFFLKNLNGYLEEQLEKFTDRLKKENIELTSEQIRILFSKTLAGKVQTVALNAYRALDYTVVHHVLGNKYPLFNPEKELGPRGISIWLPKTDEEFRERYDDFKQSLFYHPHPEKPDEVPGWRLWMATLYSAPFLMTL